MYCSPGLCTQNLTTCVAGEALPKNVDCNLIIFHKYAHAELMLSSLQIQSELSNFHLHFYHEMQVYFALGKSYDLMGKDKEARNLLEQALTLCAKNGMKESKEGAEVSRVLGWIYL